MIKLNAAIKTVEEGRYEKLYVLEKARKDKKFNEALTYILEICKGVRVIFNVKDDEK